MSRSIFGWSLPPGCTMQQIEEQAGAFALCDVCGHSIDDCICPECSICNEAGNLNCYRPEGHGLKFTKEQSVGRIKRKIAELEETISDYKMQLGMIESDPDFVPYHYYGK